MGIPQAAGAAVRSLPPHLLESQQLSWTFLKLFFSPFKWFTHAQSYLWLIHAYNGNHQPPSRAAVSTPAHLGFGPRDGGLEHLRGQRVGVLFFPTDPLTHHPRAHHGVIASQVLKEQQRNNKRYCNTTHCDKSYLKGTVHPKNKNTCFSSYSR